MKRLIALLLAVGVWTVEQEQDNPHYIVALDGRPQYEAKNLREADAITDGLNDRQHNPKDIDDQRALQQAGFERQLETLERKYK